MIISLDDYRRSIERCQLWISERLFNGQAETPEEAATLTAAVNRLASALLQLQMAQFRVSPGRRPAPRNFTKPRTFDEMFALFYETHSCQVNVETMPEDARDDLERAFPHLREAEELLKTLHRKKSPYEPPSVTTRDATDDEIACAVQAVEFRAAVDQARTYPALAALATQKALDDRNVVTLADVEARAREIGVVRIAITLGRDATIIEMWGPGTRTVVTRRPFADVLPEILGLRPYQQRELETGMGWWPRRDG